MKCIFFEFFECEQIVVAVIAVIKNPTLTTGEFFFILCSSLAYVLHFLTKLQKQKF